MKPLYSSNSRREGDGTVRPIGRQRQGDGVVQGLAWFHLPRIEKQTIEGGIFALGFCLESVERAFAFVRHGERQGHGLAGLEVYRKNRQFGLRQRRWRGSGADFIAASCDLLREAGRDDGGGDRLEAGCFVSSTAGDRGAVRRCGNCAYRTLVSGQRVALAARHHIPDANRAVSAGGGERSPVGREGDAEHVVFVPDERQVFLLGVHIPQANGAVGGSAGEQPTGRSKRDRIHRSLCPVRLLRWREVAKSHT